MVAPGSSEVLLALSCPQVRTGLCPRRWFPLLTAEINRLQQRGLELPADRLGGLLQPAPLDAAISVMKNPISTIDMAMPTMATMAMVTARTAMNKEQANLQHCTF